MGRRSKEELRKERGYSCPECEPYYEALNLSPRSKQARINFVSRHRGDEHMPLDPQFRRDFYDPGPIGLSPPRVGFSDEENDE